MSPPAFQKRPATEDDLREVPDTMVGELVDGELFATPRPSSSHAYATQNLGYELMGPFGRGRGGPGGWHLLTEPELRLGENTLVPDLAGWRTERMPTVPSVPFFVLAPDWVCEILSPSTHRLDRMRKMPAYLRAGVRHVWLVDPLQRVIEAFRSDGSAWVLVGNFVGDETARIEPFDAVELNVAVLWLPGQSE